MENSLIGKGSQIMEHDFESILNGIINEEYIQRETCVSDLKSITHLKLVIDTSQQCIFELSEILPNLKHLVLDHSNINSIRDLGIGLRHIISLSLSCCSLYDIDGIGVLTGLQELCLSDNYISDVTPLAIHENLQTLNLSGNKIKDLSVGDDLSSCLQLKSLFLQKNPISKLCNYRIIISSLINNLEMLDGVRIDQNATKKVTHSMILEAATELRLIDEDLDDELRLEQDIYATQLSHTHILLSEKSNHSIKYSNASKYVSDGIIPDTGSELTHGSSIVLAGNMAAAVRKRRQLISAANSLESAEFTSSSKAHGNDETLVLLYKRDEESALDVLDAALINNINNNEVDYYNNNTKRDKESSFLKEGDVTSVLKGNAALYVDINNDNNLSKQVMPSYGHSSRMKSSKDINKYSSSNSLEVNNNDHKLLNGSESFDFDYRPRTANSSMNDRSRVNSFRSGDSNQFIPSSSPRQRNSSRPSTAATTATSSPYQTPRKTAFNVPFKVAIEPIKSPIKIKKVLNHNKDLDIDDNIIEFNDDKVINKSNSHSSIVHLDIVKRQILFNDSKHTTNRNMNATTTNDNEEDEDNEDICVTHADRHKLMSTSAVGTCNNSATANMKNKRNILQQLKGIFIESHNDKKIKMKNSKSNTIIGIAEINNYTTGEQDLKYDNDLKKDHHHHSINTKQIVNTIAASTTTAATTSTKAGISLGFNLAGSLAAIDKWVEDMDEDDDSHGDDCSGLIKRECHSDTSEDDSDIDSISESLSRTKSKSLLFSIGPVSGTTLDIPSTTTDPHSIISNSSSTSSQKTKSKILSRDVIINMCVTSSASGSNSARALYDEDDDDDDDIILEHEINDTNQSLLRTQQQQPHILNNNNSNSNKNRLFISNHRGKIRPFTNNITTNNNTTPIMIPSISTQDLVQTTLTTCKTSSLDKNKTKIIVPEFQHSMINSSSTDNSNRNIINQDIAIINETSPPRYTSDDSIVINHHSMNSNHSSHSLGQGTLLTDSELIELLKKPPKSTIALRTKSNFQQFFIGMDKIRFKSLLNKAYEDIIDINERNNKIDKRMSLLDN